MATDVLVVIPYQGFYSDFCPLLAQHLARQSAPAEVAVKTLVGFYPFPTGRFITKAQTAFVMLANVFYLLFRFVCIGKRKYHAVVLGGHLVAIPALFLARVLAWPRATKAMIVTCFFVHELANRAVVRRILRFLLNDPRLVLVAQSPHEVEFYSRLAPRAKVSLFPFCRREVQAAGQGDAGQEYVFSGGYTNRDYACLLAAARRVPCRFIVACSRLNEVEDPPANVTVLRDIDPGEFHGYVKNATIVVIPLKEKTGASGQMVALAAMSLARPIIYTDFDCVGQYFEDGISGLAYTSGDAEDLARKIVRLLQDPALRNTMGRNIRRRYEEDFTMAQYCDFLAKLVRE